MQDEDEYGTRALGALRTREVPAPHVDVAAVTRAGRARERARWAGGGVAVAAATAVALVAAPVLLSGVGGPGAQPADRGAATAAAAPGEPDPAPDALVCTPQRLPVPTGAQAPVITGVDPTGRYLAGALGQVDDANPGRALLWTDGQLSVLAPPGTSAEAVAVNSAGVVVGKSLRAGRSFGWVYRNGTYSELAPPSGLVAVPVAINERGDIAGWAWAAGDGNETAVVWAADRPATARRLTAAGPAIASDIADDGTVVGTLGDGTRPYVWAPDGTGRPLAGPDSQSTGKVLAVAGPWAYGWAGTATSPPVARSAPSSPPAGGTAKDKNEAGSVPRWVRWHLPTGQVEVLSGIDPAGINATGLVVGTLGSAQTGGPAVLRDGAPVALPRLEERYNRGTASVISDDGRTIAGDNWANDAPGELVRWRC
ncbi:MAG TPA: hypothetical protein VK453_28080 [Micromonosporaceae bacterium]|nr:hypothetical protein [Micromonosporaceae bacterium]